MSQFSWIKHTLPTVDQKSKLERKDRFETIDYSVRRNHEAPGKSFTPNESFAPHFPTIQDDEDSQFRMGILVNWFLKWRYHFPFELGGQKRNQTFEATIAKYVFHICSHQYFLIILRQAATCRRKRHITMTYDRHTHGVNEQRGGSNLTFQFSPILRASMDRVLSKSQTEMPWLFDR